jgi:starch synthase
MHRTVSAWIPDDLSVDKNIWMLSFECQGLASVGGLGVAVYNLARALARKYRVRVFMPSHGRHLEPDIRLKYGFRRVGDYLAEGIRRGEDGKLYPYKIALERGVSDGVEYYLFSGADSETSRWLDNPIIYNDAVMFEKMSLFARGLRAYIDHLCVTSAFGDLPHLLHLHDWHTVPAGISAKQDLEERRYFCPTVFTIHLLNMRRSSWSYVGEGWCQIKDEAHFIWFNGKHHFKGGYREVWDLLAEGYFEKFGAYEADLLITVSYSYLEDILSFVGEGIRGKTGVIYNGCDWEYSTLLDDVFRTFGERIRSEFGVSEVRRWDMRRLLLTKALGEDKPFIRDEELRRLIHGFSGVGALKEGGTVKPFEEDGPLVLMTGRLDWQKGVDILLRSVPTVISKLPDTRFLLLLIPIHQTDLIYKVVYEAAKYIDNVRLIFGESKLFHLSYLSTDTYAMPSRWEPFGIAALEAMVCGAPVAGAGVGGLRETVLDIHEHREKATGMLIPPESPEALAEGLTNLLLIMKVDELACKGLNGEAKRYIDLITDPQISKMVLNNLKLGSLIRSNCIRRVTNYFRWSNAAEMAERCYNEARKMAEYRAWACFQ